MKRFFLSACLALFTFYGQSQVRDYANYPYWIAMIDQPETNYYEALKAYTIFWQNRIKPLDEEEELFQEMNEKEKEQYEVLKRELAAMTPAQRQEFDRLKYQVKRFKQWRRSVMPYVQEDGRILSYEERLKIWETQQQGQLQK
ncbi:MAG: hypothetical protein JNM44_11905 [Chitinophagaceae bacterium]|nr:hypothetical protein [Chitinophagaceae bacterium]